MASNDSQLSEVAHDLKLLPILKKEAFIQVGKIGQNVGTCCPTCWGIILCRLQGFKPDDLDQGEKADRKLGWHLPTQEPAPPQDLSLSEVINFFQGETSMRWFSGTCSQTRFVKCESLKPGGLWREVSDLGTRTHRNFE